MRKPLLHTKVTVKLRKSDYNDVNSLRVNFSLFFRNHTIALIAEVFPLLFAPTNTVTFSLKSIWQFFSLRKFLIWTDCIFILTLNSIKILKMQAILSLYGQSHF